MAKEKPPSTYGQICKIQRGRPQQAHRLQEGQPRTAQQELSQGGAPPIKVKTRCGARLSSGVCVPNGRRETRGPLRLGQLKTLQKSLRFARNARVPTPPDIPSADRGGRDARTRPPAHAPARSSARQGKAPGGPAEGGGLRMPRAPGRGGGACARSPRAPGGGAGPAQRAGATAPPRRRLERVLPEGSGGFWKTRRALGGAPRL